jgi:hypothetical protein
VDIGMPESAPTVKGEAGESSLQLLKRLEARVGIELLVMMQTRNCLLFITHKPQQSHLPQPLAQISTKSHSTDPLDSEVVVKPKRLSLLRLGLLHNSITQWKGAK